MESMSDIVVLSATFLYSKSHIFKVCVVFCFLFFSKGGIVFGFDLFFKRQTSRLEILVNT